MSSHPQLPVLTLSLSISLFFWRQLKQGTFETTEANDAKTHFLIASSKYP
jgi:hypothetical protein